MGLLEFDKLPINTLVGADWDTFRKVTARQQIDKGFKGKYRLTTGVCRLLSALKPIEDSRFKKLADKPLEDVMNKSRTTPPMPQDKQGVHLFFNGCKDTQKKS